MTLEDFMNNQVEIYQPIEQHRVEVVLNYFSTQSGVDLSSVQEGLGPWILDQLHKPPEQILSIHFLPEDPKYNDFLQDYNKYQLLVGDDKALTFFWRDILTYRYMNDPGFHSYVDSSTGPKFVELLKNNSQAMFINALRLYESGSDNINIVDIISAENKISLEASLAEGETIETRLQITQHGFQEAFRIGMGLYKSGKIPCYRILFFDSDETKNVILEKYSGAQTFETKGNIPLGNLTLEDIIKHTGARSENSPIESWTYLPPNADWRFGQRRLGQVPAVMVVSAIEPNELLFAKTFGNSIFGSETWEFFKPSDPKSLKSDCLSITSKTSLGDLNAGGKRGVLVPNEGEISLWGNQPLLKIIDIGP